MSKGLFVFRFLEMFCTTCGQPRTHAARFCAFCGQSVLSAPDAPFARADALLRQGEPAKAEAELRRFIAAQGDDAAARALLGSALMAQFQFDDAREELDAAVRIDPDDAFVRVKRAEYFFRLGLFRDAEQELELAKQSPVADPTTYFYARQLLNEVRTRARRSFTRQTLSLDFDRVFRSALSH